MEELIKTYLKNKCTYACKQGYLTESTNQKWHRHNDEEEQEEEKQDGDEETEEGNGWWSRGDGWNRGPSNSDDANDDMYGSDVAH